MNGIFEIHIKGHLDVEWQDWFEGFSITHLPDGTTLLRGEVADQPALHSLLLQIGQLGLTLLKVEETQED